MTCGIYLILCNGKPYVGQSVDIEARWKVHLRKLKKNAHWNPILQRTWNKYGAGAFEFKILEKCQPNQLTQREQHWYDQLNSHKNGCNLAPAADSPTLGRGHTEATKKKLKTLRQDARDSKRHFDANQVLDIWSRYMDGESGLSIAVSYGVGAKIIQNIVSRKYYREIDLPPSCRAKEYRRKGGGRKPNVKSTSQLFARAGKPIPVRPDTRQSD